MWRILNSVAISFLLDLLQKQIFNDIRIKLVFGKFDVLKLGLNYFGFFCHCEIFSFPFTTTLLHTHSNNLLLIALAIQWTLCNLNTEVGAKKLFKLWEINLDSSSRVSVINLICLYIFKPVYWKVLVKEILKICMKMYFFEKKIRKLFTWFLKLYLSVGAFLQKWLPCLISDVNLCRMKTNKVGIIWTFDLAFNDRFDIPSGKDPACATFFFK